MSSLGKLAKVREAIDRGGDVNEKNFTGSTGLMYAMQYKHNSIVKLLLEQPMLDLNLTDSWGETALHIAVFNDNVEGVKLLLADPRLNTHNLEDADGDTPLMTAVQYSNLHKNVGALCELVAHPSVNLYAQELNFYRDRSFRTF